ncbi:MAG: hypothetical protein ACYTAN_06040 [Planctomycetota bacterium]
MSHLRRSERGAALILVIGVLVLLSIIGTAFVALMQIERSASRNFGNDIRVRQLAERVAAYVMQHPNWDPPTGTDIDNDGIGGPDSAFLTQPFADYTSDFTDRVALLKKPFGGRVNVNWNSFYMGASSDNHILNEGVSTGEISLVRPLASYLDYLGTIGVPVGLPAENVAVAEEIARRLCNRRYGSPQGALGPPPYQVGTFTNAKPGQDNIDDDNFLHDTSLPFEPPAPPNGGRDIDDAATWVGLNFRPDTAIDGVDENGDGLFDEAGEATDGPFEYTEYPLLLTGTWPLNDDQPFGSADLQSIIDGVSASDLRAEINDVCQTWAVGQGYAYNNATDYFSYLRVLLTTFSRDYVGDMTPLNHLNLLMPAGATDPERAKVSAGRSKFVAALRAAFQADGMSAAAADLTAWQVLATLVDFLDEDPDPAGVLGDLGLLNALARPEGWDESTDDSNANGFPDPGEPNTRTVFGTERQPYINEVWVYNRGDDRFDNDGDTVVDDSDPLLHPLPLEDPAAGPNNAWFIELFNLYATDTVLYNNPANPGDPTIDWYIRIKDNAGNVVPPVRRFSGAQVWQAGAWVAAPGASSISVPAGGYLVIQSRDYRASDDAQLTAASLKVLPNPGAMPPGAILVNLNLAAGVKLFDADYEIELVYSYDADGAGLASPLEAVVDKQKLPSNLLNIEAGGGTGTYDLVPSWERHDPRLARVIRLPLPAGASAVGDLLLPTWSYRNAESTAPGSGGDLVRHTLGTVNDADDGDADDFDGNYDVGANSGLNYDDLVDVPNLPTWKFANVGALGKLLCAGPLPADPTGGGWSDPATVSTSAADYWLIQSSPYTAVPANAADPSKFQNMPLDAKKVNFTEQNVYDWAGDITTLPTGAPANFATGRATAIFDKFTTIWPRLDGKDNDGDWNATVDETDATDTDLPPDGLLDPAPTPGDGHVDEADELYVYGRVDINNSPTYVLSALPYVTFDDSTFYRPGSSNVTGVFLTAATDTVTGAGGIIDYRNTGGLFADRRDFLTRVVRPAVNSVAYNPPGGQGTFGKDIEDNHLCENASDVPRRTAWAFEWDTIQRPPRTVNDTLLPYDFILPGASANSDGRDLLTDDKSEVDYTVGALMNMVALETELPSDFAATGGAPGIYTYFITVQVTDGADVDGIADNGRTLQPGIPADGVGGATPDWKEGTVLAEKRLVVLVNTQLPATDPGRVTVFSWATEGRAPER